LTEFDQLQIRKLDGGLLLVFRGLLATRRAGAVAQQLGLSPSSISHALGRLREVFGDPLFVRRAHGLEPTRRALELGPRIEALLEAIGEAVGAEVAFDPAVSRRRFRIACADPVASFVGPRLVETFRAEAPHATFSARPGFLDQALRAVRRREVDLALGVFGQVPAGLAATPLYDDEYCVIARRGHPLAADGRVERQVYDTVGHIFVGNPDRALTDESPVDREAMDATYGGLPEPDAIRTHAYVSLWETAMLIVATSDVMSDCPRRLAERYAAQIGLQVLAPPYRPFRMTVQAVRRAGEPDTGLDWLVARLAAAVEG
jgi:DNA-binding transcriptional LysR family regulator